MNDEILSPNQVLDVAAFIPLGVLGLGYLLGIFEKSRRPASTLGFVIIVLASVAILSNCASAPTSITPIGTPSNQPPPQSSTSQGRCLDMLATACLHADACDIFGETTARECFGAAADQCAGILNVTQAESDRCIIAIADAPCEVAFPKECEGIADRASPQPDERGL